MNNEQKQHYREVFTEAIEDAVNEAILKAQNELNITDGNVFPITAVKLGHNIDFLVETMVRIIVQQEGLK